MIFHTSTDPVYFEKFYQKFYDLLKLHNSDARFSLHYIGYENLDVINFCSQNQIFLSIEEKSINDISKMYQQPEENSYGYYAIGRWTSIPIQSEAVFVSDVDLFAVNSIDIELVNSILKNYDAINITRLKPNGTHGGMASIILSPKILQEVKTYAIKTLQNENLHWALDVNIKKYIYDHFNVFEINNNVIDVTKNQHKRENLFEWFILSKGKTPDSKINRINSFLSNNCMEKI